MLYTAGLQNSRPSRGHAVHNGQFPVRWFRFVRLQPQLRTPIPTASPGRRRAGIALALAMLIVLLPCAIADAQATKKSVVSKKPALAKKVGTAKKDADPGVQHNESVPERLELGQGAPAYFYRPKASGQRPVVMYLHGRGGNPEQDCMKWAKVARDVGWLLCPSGIESRGGGGRGWSNNWRASKGVVDRALAALREKFGRRVQLYGNILVGYSEGAFVAMNIGVREPRVYNRWLILAANDSYWLGEGEAELRSASRRIKRVYLLTGERDLVVANTRRVFDILDELGVRVIVRTPGDLGHEIPDARMKELYERPLRWLAAAP